MKAPNLLLQAALLLIFLGPAMPLHAQVDPKTVGSDLYVCNKGTVAVEVVAATRGLDILRGFDKYYWTIEGVTVAPQDCANVVKDPFGEFSYIAFGLADSKGGWVSGTIAQVPDIGSIKHLFARDDKVLTGATKAMCARKGATYYVIDDDFSVACAPLKLTGRGRDLGEGPLLPLTSALYFHPDAHVCPEVVIGVPSSYYCELTHFYLNVSPSATDRELHAAPGTNSGAGDASSSLCGKVSCWDQLLQGLNQAAAQQSAANTNNNPPSRRPSTNQPPPPAPAVTPLPPVDDDDPIGHGGFIAAPASPAPASDRAKSLPWVRDELVAYIQASQTGFAAYKKGDALLSQGYRMWDSSVKPSEAKGCWVVQGTTGTTLSCLLSERADLTELRSYYTQLTKDVTASLPRDWKTQAEPPFGGDLPNQGYRSSSGAHLEVWIARAASGTVYEIHFQLVSAH